MLLSAQRVVSSTTNPSVEEGLRRVKESFRGKGGLADEDDDDDDEDLMATVTRISVRCPVGLVPIDMPAKGRHCNHLQVGQAMGSIGWFLGGGGSPGTGLTNHRVIEQVTLG
jgi:hypothetical protein